jgi:hypothetical protein
VGNVGIAATADVVCASRSVAAITKDAATISADGISKRGFIAPYRLPA